MLKYITILLTIGLLYSVDCPDGYLDNSSNQTGPGEVCIPESFAYNSSTQSASYLVYDITINGEGVDSEDWVAAFNGDVCVGARKWDTSVCNNGLCDVPANGYDASPATLGYLSNNQIPTFRIYDSSENTYYSASVDGEIVNLFTNATGGGFSPNSYFTIDTLYTDGILCPQGYLFNAGSTEECTPEQFLYNSSTMQAGYFFYNVTLDNNPISKNDWVAAFNGDICVGVRKWDTEECGGGICDVPVLGQSSQLTLGYMSYGEYPSFKIFRASDLTYHDASPSLDVPWQMFATPTIDLLAGCSNGLVLDECGVCGGQGLTEGICDCDGNIEDCEGVCGGVAIEDECGVCGGNGVDVDEDGICDDIDDCVGEYDECGACGGNGVEEACGCEDTSGLNGYGCCDDIIIGCDGICGSCPEGYVCNSGSTEECTPIDFIYSSSMNLAAYFFYNVTLEGTSITSNDWVGAFNGDQCVGSRQWDTSLCGSGICDVPVGPITSNDGYPTFKIFRASDGTYHDAYASLNQEWYPFATPEIDFLSECQLGQPADCNGDCDGKAILDDCGICEGNNASKDCAGICYGNAVEDCYGVCNGNAIDLDDDGICDDIDDCVGIYDECGMCNGGGIPDGICDCFGNILDCLGVCGGSSENLGCGCGLPGPSGCDNQCGSILEFDECGECGGSGIPEGACDCNGNILDCNNVCGGDAEFDNCNVCDNNVDNDCIQDCAGIWGGNTQFDECNICGGSNSSCTDCNGDLFGEAYIDGCSICVGGNTSETPCPSDCNGVEGGIAYYDECGNCIEEPDPNCIVDCAGNWGGDAIEDACGICNGTGYEDDCGVCDSNPSNDGSVDNCGICDADLTNDCIQDCNGVWGGDSIDLGCGCNLPGPSGCDEKCDSSAIYDCLGICGGDAVNLGCGCNLPGPSGCDNKCGSILEFDECDVCGGDNDCMNSEIPTVFNLIQNYPNPFNASTTIEFSINKNSYMNLSIYDMMGKRVKIVLSEFLLEGSYSTIWNGMDNYGNMMPSGIYIAILEGNNMISSIKLTLMK